MIMLAQFFGVARTQGTYRSGRNRCKRLLTFCQSYQEFLSVEGYGRRAPASIDARSCADVLARWLQNSRLCRVGEVSLENFLPHSLPQQWIEYRENYLHAFVQIARHPVGAAEIELLITSVRERVDAAVFQQTSHNAAHANAVAYSTQSGTQRAHATHDQINFNTSLRCVIQRLND